MKNNATPSIQGFSPNPDKSSIGGPFPFLAAVKSKSNDCPSDYNDLSEKVNTMISKQKEQDQQFKDMQKELKDIKELLGNLAPNDNTPNFRPLNKLNSFKDFE